MRSTTESGNSSIESGVMEASAAQGLSLGPEEAEDRSSNPSDHDAGKGRVEDSAAGHAELLHAAAHAAALADDADGGEQDFSLGQRRTSKQGRPAARVDENRMRTMFGMPQPEAAKALGVSLTTLKQACRRLGLSRWPYRRPSKGNARGSADTLNVPGHQQHALSTMPHKGPLWTGELLRDGDLCSPLMLQTPHGQQQFGASGMVGGGVPIVQGIGGCPPTRGFHMPRVCEPHPRSWNEAAVISGPNFAMAPGRQPDLEIRSQWWGSLGQRGGRGLGEEGNDDAAFHALRSAGFAHSSSAGPRGLLPPQSGPAAAAAGPLLFDPRADPVQVGRFTGMHAGLVAGTNVPSGAWQLTGPPHFGPDAPASAESGLIFDTMAGTVGDGFGGTMAPQISALSGPIGVHSGWGLSDTGVHREFQRLFGGDRAVHRWL